MSRIGKKPILIPKDVEIKIDDRKVTVQGPRGELWREVRPEISLKIKDKEILVSLKRDINKNKKFWGLTRTLIDNMVQGVVSGFEKKLEIQGVGYRAALEKGDLVLHLGFTQPVRIEKLDNIEFGVDKNIITVSGIDKEKVGQVSAKIRSMRVPEPYKGKGIRYVGEFIRKKEGKKAAGASQ